jgi:hypothetical protein
MLTAVLCVLIWPALIVGICWLIDVGKVPHEREEMAQRVRWGLDEHYILSGFPWAKWGPRA